MTPRIIALAAATAIGLGWVTAGTAGAGTVEGIQLAQAQPMEGQGTAADFTDQQIESFAQAHQQIVMLQQQYGPEQEDMLRQRAAEIISAQGLTIDEYNQIYLAAQRDEELRQQVVQEARDME